MNKKQTVALRYPEGAAAPFIVAKGRGDLADRILQIAKENNVHVEQDEITAQILSLYEVGDLIPPETYEVVAGIFSFLIRMKDEQN